MEKIRTLIADDVEGLRTLLKAHLKQFNCDVIREVADGSEVLDAIQQSAPDMVFLDINMPGKNGLDILKEVSEQKIHDKVWIISGDDDQQTIRQAQESGAKGFISKPFTLEKLEQTFRLYHKIADNKKSAGTEPIYTKVILADDEESIRDQLEKELINCQCVVEAKFSSGNELINMLESGWVPEMSFIDTEMPNGNGLQALKYIKDNVIPTFSVIVGTQGTVENIKTAMDAGADGFIVKPYSEKKIEQLVEKYKQSKGG